MTRFADPASAVAWLRTTEAVRARCALLYDAARSGATAWFALDEERLGWTADYVERTIRANYPDLAIPYHSRWRHFGAGGVDRWAPIAAALAPRGREAVARAAIDLAVVSVLLDAGAGPAWRYRDRDGRDYGRSEGLALASLAMFAAGAFSAVPGEPWRVDAEALLRLDAGALAGAFQVRGDNPLVGLDGRADLLRRLGAALAANPALFGREAPRPGGLLDRLAASAAADRLAAPAILGAVLEGFQSIWPARLTLGGIPLGDVGRHPAARADDLTDGLVPFHKLSQWLSYSLVEPFEWAGVAVVELDRMTGLPEYRNGGLFLDAGVLAAKDPRVLVEKWPADSEPVVEWRALTVVLLDRLADLLRARLGFDAQAFPLAKVLEGGTWAAGRKIARERRPDGSPPIEVLSDGTIF